MVALPRFGYLAVLFSIFNLATAQLQVIFPGGPDRWWVDGTDNNLSWNCYTNTNPLQQNFTVLVSNQQLNMAPLALFAVLQADNCPKTFPAVLFKFTPATGYTVLLANPLNSSDIFTTSQPFEVKVAGSAYPSDTTPSQPAPSSASATGAAAPTSTGTKSSDATLNTPATLLLNMVFALLGILAVESFSS